MQNFVALLQISMSVHEKQKMPQESYPPAVALT